MVSVVTTTVVVVAVVDFLLRMFEDISSVARQLFYISSEFDVVSRDVRFGGELLCLQFSVQRTCSDSDYCSAALSFTFFFYEFERSTRGTIVVVDLFPPFSVSLSHILSHTHTLVHTPR